MFIHAMLSGMLETIDFIALSGMFFATGGVALKVITSELKLRALVKANNKNAG